MPSLLEFTERQMVLQTKVMQCQISMHNCEPTTYCLFENVHRRMDDAHTLWHSALDEYFDPQKFRASLQSCIIALRSVTFILQNEKHSIPEYENWYSTWQSRMRDDPLMRWAVDSRNTIEKQGDLKKHSQLVVSVIAEYSNGLPEIKTNGNLFESVKELLSRIDKDVLELQVLEHGTIKIERRWVANTLPEFEILDALAEIHGKLSLLLDDAHKQVGLPIPFLIHPDPEKIIPVGGGGPSGGRLPCMIGHDERRGLIFSLKTGERLEFASESIDTEDAERQAKERYGTNLLLRKPNDDSLLSTAASYFECARTMFLADGYHQVIALLFTGRTAKILGFELNERREKYLAMRRLATEVDRRNADRVMLIAETWTALAEPETPFAIPSDSKERSEKLFLWATSRQGENVSLSAEIVRHGTEVTLADTVVDLDAYSFIFEPIRDLWKKRKLIE